MLLLHRYPHPLHNFPTCSQPPLVFGSTVAGYKSTCEKKRTASSISCWLDPMSAPVGSPLMITISFLLSFSFTGLIPFIWPLGEHAYVVEERHSLIGTPTRHHAGMNAAHIGLSGNDDSSSCPPDVVLRVLFTNSIGMTLPRLAKLSPP